MVTKIKNKEFETSEKLCSWANGQIATTDVIAICVNPTTTGTSFVLFYKKEET